MPKSFTESKGRQKCVSFLDSESFRGEKLVLCRLFMFIYCSQFQTPTPSGRKRRVGKHIKQPARPKEDITLADSDLDQADEMDQADEVTDTSSQSTSEIQVSILNTRSQLQYNCLYWILQ